MEEYYVLLNFFNLKEEMRIYICRYMEEICEKYVEVLVKDVKVGYIEVLMVVKVDCLEVVNKIKCYWRIFLELVVKWEYVLVNVVKLVIVICNISGGFKFWIEELIV